MVRKIQTRPARGSQNQRGKTMVDKEHKTVDDPQIPDDPEVAMVQQATRQGTLNIVGDILNDPKVQDMIKTALLRETIKNSLFFACFIVGLLKLYDVAKAVVGFGLIGDLAVSVILILIGLIYMIPNMFKGKQDGHAKTDNKPSYSS
jgi:hypothetical protein